MKKTIIALMALAGVASADISINRGGNYYAEDYTFSFAITEAQITGGLITNDVLLAYGNKFDGTTNTANDCCINAYTLSVVDNAVVMTVGCGTLTNIGDDKTISDSTTFVAATFQSYVSADRLASMFAVDSNGDATTTTYTLGAGIYEVKVTGASQSQRVDLYKDGIIVAKAGRLSGNSVTLGYNGNMTNGHDTSIAVSFNSAYAVPEPTTATLSLLALAGLAARRRRR